MENNFYLGTICHSKKLNRKFLSSPYRVSVSLTEKKVLYSEDYINFIDLVTGNVYPIEKKDNSYQKVFVIKSSLINTNISEYKTDYMYLLSCYKNEQRLLNGIKRKVKIK